MLLDAQTAPLDPPQGMQPVAGVLAARVKTYDTMVLLPLLLRANDSEN